MLKQDLVPFLIGRDATATPTGIGVAGAFRTIGQVDRGCHQFEMGVIPVLGIRQHFGQRQVEALDVDPCDGAHGGRPGLL